MDEVRRMKGLVLEERKARQLSTKSKVMPMSVSNSKQEQHWKEGNCRVSAGVLDERITRKCEARRGIREWLARVLFTIMGGKVAAIFSTVLNPLSFKLSIHFKSENEMCVELYFSRK